MNNVYNSYFFNEFYQENGGGNYTDEKLWTPFFEYVAEKIVTNYAPKTVLDVGCAYGYLVEALRKKGVEAYGIDISEYAIGQAAEEIRPYVFVNSADQELPEKMPKRYDLIVSIEVLEHMTQEAGETALNYLCSLTDTFVFSSTDSDLQDITHINVQRKEYWARIFAKNGFFRDVQQRPLFISEQADVYRRRTDIENLMQEYEVALRVEQAKEKEYHLPCQVYYNTGNGFSEDRKILIQHAISGEKIGVEIEVSAEMTELRFDPTEIGYCVVSNLEVWLNEKRLSANPVNGEIYGEEWVFSTLDPQILIPVEEGGRLRITGKFYFLGDCRIPPNILFGIMNRNGINESATVFLNQMAEKQTNLLTEFISENFEEQKKKVLEDISGISEEQKKEYLDISSKNAEGQKECYELICREIKEQVKEFQKTLGQKIEEQRDVYMNVIQQLNEEQRKFFEAVERKNYRLNKSMQKSKWVAGERK